MPVKIIEQSDINYLKALISCVTSPDVREDMLVCLDKIDNQKPVTTAKEYLNLKLIKLQSEILNTDYEPEEE